MASTPCVLIRDARGSIRPNTLDGWSFDGALPQALQLHDGRQEGAARSATGQERRGAGTGGVTWRQAVGLLVRVWRVRRSLSDGGARQRVGGAVGMAVGASGALSDI